MNWTKILADAGIPESPGRAETIEAMRRRAEAKKAEAEREMAAAMRRNNERLAAKGDSKKAIRSKLRLGG